MLISLLHTQASNARPPQRHCTAPPPLPAQHVALPRLPKGEEKDLRTGTYLGLHNGTAGEEPQRKTEEATDRGRDRDGVETWRTGVSRRRRACCWTRRWVGPGPTASRALLEGHQQAGPQGLAGSTAQRVQLPLPLPPGMGGGGKATTLGPGMGPRRKPAHIQAALSCCFPR